MKTSGPFRILDLNMITRHEPLHERYRRSADTGVSYLGRDHASGTRSPAVNRIPSGKWFNSNLAPLMKDGTVTMKELKRAADSVLIPARR